MLFAQEWPADIEATYTPLRTDDLKPGARERIGQTTTWMYSGVVDFGGPYDGQRQWSPVVPWKDMAWVPECDLTIVREDTTT